AKQGVRARVPGSKGGLRLAADLFRCLLAFGQSPVAVCRQVGPLLRLTLRPGDADAVNLVGVAEAEEVPRVAGRGVAAAALGEARLLAAAGFQHGSGAAPVAGA